MTAQILNVPKPEWLDQEDVNIFDGAVRSFIEKECLPHGDRWEKEGMVDREVWNKAGENGLLCPAAPEEYGGAGGDLLYPFVAAEALLLRQSRRGEARHSRRLNILFYD